MLASYQRDRWSDKSLERFTAAIKQARRKVIAVSMR
jgi:hypothetical protein